MTVNLIAALLLLLHLGCCLLIWLGIRGGILRVEPWVMPVVIFVPVWGALCVLIRHFGVWLNRDGTKEVGREKLQINEQLYRSFFVSPEENERSVVPLEEALVVNDTGLRREMMMNVLNDDPTQYIDFLHQAQMNEDAEVVHYAATAMAEISKNYESQLQMLEEAYRNHPKDSRIREEYCDFLEEYLAQGIMHGQMERQRRQRHCQLLQLCFQDAPSLPILTRLTENYLLLREFPRAEQTLEVMGRSWPQQEEYWLLRIKCAAMQEQGGKVRHILREMRDRQIYLSRKGALQLKFWEKGKEERNEEAAVPI